MATSCDDYDDDDDHRRQKTTTMGELYRNWAALGSVSCDGLHACIKGLIDCITQVMIEFGERE